MATAHRAMLFAINLLYSLGSSYGETLSRTNHRSDCSKPTDVVFVLDASNSIWPPDFEKQLQFVNSVIRDLPIDQTMIRIGVIAYSHLVRVAFGFTAYSSSDAVSKAVSRVSQHGGNTRTDLALQRMKEMFDAEGRNGVSRLGIVITDGQSDSPPYTAREAKVVHRKGITLLSIGVGNKTDPTELKEIASREDLAFHVDSYEALERIQEMIAKKACDPEQQTEGCVQQPGDIVFTLPNSIADADTNYGLQFLTAMAGRLNLEANQIRLGLAPRLCHAISGFTLEKGTDYEQVSRYVYNQRPTGRVEEIVASLRYLRYGSYGQAADERREGSTKIAVVIVDGKSTQLKQSAIDEAVRLKEQGILIIVISVGEKSSSPSETELKMLAGCPTCVLNVETYPNLNQLVKPLFMVVRKHMCITTK